MPLMRCMSSRLLHARVFARWLCLGRVVRVAVGLFNIARQARRQMYAAEGGQHRKVTARTIHLKIVVGIVIQSRCEDSMQPTNGKCKTGFFYFPGLGQWAVPENNLAGFVVARQCAHALKQVRAVEPATGW